MARTDREMLARSGSMPVLPGISASQSGRLGGLSGHLDLDKDGQAAFHRRQPRFSPRRSHTLRNTAPAAAGRALPYLRPRTD
jgi:hypothetical protein